MNLVFSIALLVVCNAIALNAVCPGDENGGNPRTQQPTTEEPESNKCTYVKDERLNTPVTLLDSEHVGSEVACCQQCKNSRFNCLVWEFNTVWSKREINCFMYSDAPSTVTGYSAAGWYRGSAPFKVPGGSK